MNLVKTDIYVIDYAGSSGEPCSCGKSAVFVLGVSGHQIHICEVCIAETAKRIIDGLT